MRGIILAGGASSRLLPITTVMSKQLLPLWDKPVIFYSLSVLLLAKIKNILLISTPSDLILYKKLFKDIKRLGINIEFAEQEKPNGIAESFIIGEQFIDKDNVCLMLGDNVILGHGTTQILQDTVSTYNKLENESLAIIFGHGVKDPSRFGVAEIDKDSNVLSLEEKPSFPKSNIAVIGLYFYTNDAIYYSKQLKPSARNELEITDLNKIYLENKKLKLKHLGRGYLWADIGTHEAINTTANYIRIMEEATGEKFGCIEEIAYNNGYISKEQLLEIGNKYPGSSYYQYITRIAKEN